MEYPQNLIKLCSIKEVGGARAKLLYQNGIRTPQDAAKAENKKIIEGNFSKSIATKIISSAKTLAMI